jgi:hypothetical protein
MRSVLVRGSAPDVVVAGLRIACPLLLVPGVLACATAAPPGGGTGGVATGGTNTSGQDVTIAGPVDSGGKTACVPGATANCACPGGPSGVQTCNSAGTGYGSCDCPTVDPCKGKQCGPNGSGGSCGACGTGEICNVEGKCVATGPGPCSLSSPSGTCPSGQTCVAGACCDAMQACGSSCCAAGSMCVQDQSGNLKCRGKCQASSDCGASEPCCAFLAGGKKSACLTFAESGHCRCATNSDCATFASQGLSSCAPQGDANKQIVTGPLECRPNDGKPFHGCTGKSCGSGWDCWKATQGADFTEFCTKSCSAETCGNAASCHFDGKCANAAFGCSGKGFCAPDQ